MAPFLTLHPKTNTNMLSIFIVVGPEESFGVERGRTCGRDAFHSVPLKSESGRQTWN